MQARRHEQEDEKPQVDSSSETPAVGELLRRERVLRQDSLDIISDRLKIRTIFLDAIERQAYEELPGEPYSTGFIRGWAKLYELDVEALTKQFRSETQHLQEEDGSIPEIIPDQTPLFRWPTIIGSIIAVIAIGVGWHFWHKSGQEDQSIVATQSFSPKEPETKLIEDVKSNQQEVTSFEETTTRPTTETQTSPDSAELKASITQSLSSPNSIKQESAILLRATGPCWVEIKDQQTGAVVMSRIMREGENYAVPQFEGLTAKIGNPSALSVTIGETTMTPLRSSGQPITIDLNADALLSTDSNN